MKEFRKDALYLLCSIPRFSLASKHVPWLRYSLLHGLQSYDFPESERNDIERCLSAWQPGSYQFLLPNVSAGDSDIYRLSGCKPVLPDCFYSVRWYCPNLWHQARYGDASWVIWLTPLVEKAGWMYVYARLYKNEKRATILLFHPCQRRHIANTIFLFQTVWMGWKRPISFQRLSLPIWIPGRVQSGCGKSLPVCSLLLPLRPIRHPSEEICPATWNEEDWPWYAARPVVKAFRVPHASKSVESGAWFLFAHTRWRIAEWWTREK